jgi:hypothetical protein
VGLEAPGIATATSCSRWCPTPHLVACRRLAASQSCCRRRMRERRDRSRDSDSRNSFPTAGTFSTTSPKCAACTWELSTALSATDCSRPMQRRCSYLRRVYCSFARGSYIANISIPRVCSSKVTGGACPGCQHR